MQDGFKNLTPQQMARLIQYAEGGTSDEQMDGGRLHAEKNAPWVNGAYSSMRFPPYVFQPYPKWLFTAQWVRLDEQYRNALRLRVRNRDDDTRDQIIKDAEAARAEAMHLVQGPEEEKALGPSWFESPQAAVEGQERLDRAVAAAAAESNWDDRRMGEQAKRERALADDLSDGHLVEVARTPVRPKRKTVMETVEALAHDGQ